MKRILRLVVLVLLLAGVDARAQPGTSAWNDLTVVITGANRGIGLEFARQLHAAGAVVIGTARDPARAQELRDLGVRVEQLDVADPASITAFAERMGDTAVDVLLNNAGIFPSRDGIESADLDALVEVFAVNTLGPMRVTQALLAHLRRGQRKLVMNMSSGMGSIANNRGGSSAGYRESKAALNMFTRSLAAELRREGFTAIAMSPGWVATDMGGSQAPLSPEDSVRGMLAVLAGVSVEESGRFLDHRGEELAW